MQVVSIRCVSSSKLAFFGKWVPRFMGVSSQVALAVVAGVCIPYLPSVLQVPAQHLFRAVIEQQDIPRGSQGRTRSRCEPEPASEVVFSFRDAAVVEESCWTIVCGWFFSAFAIFWCGYRLGSWNKAEAVQRGPEPAPRSMARAARALADEGLVVHRRGAWSAPRGVRSEELR